MNDRIARLRELLEQPLLVTDPTNVRYLVGFDSSNCALHVEDDEPPPERALTPTNPPTASTTTPMTPPMIHGRRERGAGRA